MSSVQPLFLYSVKLKCPNDLVHLSSDSSEGELSNVSIPSPIADIPISDSKCIELSQSVFILIGSFG
jgi:hypothetical protein